MSEEKHYGCIVVGGGPAGMTAVLYLVRSGVSVAWVEKLAPGGQLLLTGDVDNYPGFPEGISGHELADKFAHHLDNCPAERYSGEVTAMEYSCCNKPFIRVKVTDKWISASSLIICTGAVHRRLGLPREEALTGRGVSYCAICDGHFYRGQPVALVGGGNSALEEALFLANVVERVYLIHRRDQFRAIKIFQDKVTAHPKITILYDTVVVQLEGEHELTGLKLKNVVNEEESVLKVNGVFVFVGLDPQGGFFPVDLALDKQGFVITTPDMQTNLPGVFAAGDIRSKNCRQLTTAVGDGAAAATAAFSYLEQMHG